jgi:hypothetical protein
MIQFLLIAFLSRCRLRLSLSSIRRSFLNYSITRICSDVVDSPLGIAQLLADGTLFSLSIEICQSTILSLFQCKASKLLAMLVSGEQLLPACRHLLLCTLELLGAAIQILLKLLFVQTFDNNSSSGHISGNSRLSMLVNCIRPTRLAIATSSCTLAKLLLSLWHLPFVGQSNIRWQIVSSLRQSNVRW